MTEARPFRWLNLWLGGLIAGILGFAGFIAASAIIRGPGFPVVVLGIALALAVVGLAYWLHLRGNTDLAQGLIGGYAMLTLISGGECTLFVTPQGGDVGVLAGFFFYPLILGAALIVGTIVYWVSRMVTRKEEDQG